jgi:hypothetical protein
MPDGRITFGPGERKINGEVHKDFDVLGRAGRQLRHDL